MYPSCPTRRGGLKNPFKKESQMPTVGNMKFPYTKKGKAAAKKAKAKAKAKPKSKPKTKKAPKNKGKKYYA